MSILGITSSSSSSSSHPVPTETASKVFAIPELLQHIAQYASPKDGSHLASTCSNYNRGMSDVNFLFHHKTGLVTKRLDKSARECWQAYKTIVQCGVPPFMVDLLGDVFNAGKVFNRLPRLIKFTEEAYPELALADLPASICRGVFRRLPEPEAGIQPMDLSGPANVDDIEEALAIRRNQADTSAHYRPFLAMRVESLSSRQIGVRNAMRIPAGEKREQALEEARARPPERAVEIFTRHYRILDLWETLAERGFPYVIPNRDLIRLPAQGKQLIQAMGDKFSRLMEGGNVGFLTQPARDVDDGTFFVEFEVRTVPSNEEGKEQSIVSLI